MDTENDFKFAGSIFILGAISVFFGDIVNTMNRSKDMPKSSNIKKEIIHETIPFEGIPKLVKPFKFSLTGQVVQQLPPPPKFEPLYNEDEQMIWGQF